MYTFITCIVFTVYGSTKQCIIIYNICNSCLAAYAYMCIHTHIIHNILYIIYMYSSFEVFSIF